MNQKDFANIILIGVLVVLVGAGGYFALSKKSGTSSDSSLTSNPKLGKLSIDLNAVMELQKEVDEGHQPWRLDPEMVAQVAIYPDGIGTENKILQLMQVSLDTQKGKAVFILPFEGKDYEVTVIQPVVGQNKIWVVSDMEYTQPTPDTGWKTYTNIKFGYQFQYPKDWTIVTDNDTVSEKSSSVSLNSPETMLITGETWDMSISPNSANSRKTLQENFPGDTIITLSENGHSMNLVLHNKNSTTEKIISTFKFTEPFSILKDCRQLSPSGQVSSEEMLCELLKLDPNDPIRKRYEDMFPELKVSETWKTYTNVQYEFEVKYPPELSVKIALPRAYSPDDDNADPVGILYTDSANDDLLAKISIYDPNWKPRVDAIGNLWRDRKAIEFAIYKYSDKRLANEKESLNFQIETSKRVEGEAYSSAISEKKVVSLGNLKINTYKLENGLTFSYFRSLVNNDNYIFEISGASPGISHDFFDHILSTFKFTN